MAMISANRDQRAIPKGRIVHTVVLTSLNVAKDLLIATEESGFLIVGGQLDISGAGAFELKVGSESKLYRKFAGAFVLGFDDEEDIRVMPGETLIAESDADIDIDGYLILVAVTS